MAREDANLLQVLGICESRTISSPPAEARRWPSRLNARNDVDQACVAAETGLLGRYRGLHNLTDRSKLAEARRRPLGLNARL